MAKKMPPSRAKTASKATAKQTGKKVAGAARRVVKSNVPAKTAGATGLGARGFSPPGGRASAARRPPLRAVSRTPDAERVASARLLASTLAATASPRELHKLLAVLTGADEAADAEVWGAAPDDVAVADAVAANLRKRFTRRRAVERDAVTRATAAELLGTSEMTVTNWLEAGHLVGLKRGKAWRIPAWQLDPDTEQGILPGIAAVRAAFPGGAVALSLWATRPSADLADRTPREALAAGDVEAVAAAAGALTAAGW